MPRVYDNLSRLNNQFSYLTIGGILGFVMMITYQLKEVSTRFMDSTAAQKTTIIILDVVTQVFFTL